MAQAKNLAGIAKKSGTTTPKKTAARKPAARKPAAKKPVEKKLSAVEERDLKAKARVEELLQDSLVTTLKNKDELLELDETSPVVEEQGIEWLQEQVGLQATLIETLRRELAEAKSNVPAGSDDGTKKALITLFNELQENHKKAGNNFIIYPVAFMNRMTKFFPFLVKEKRY